jgi:hypothetical protein
MSKKKDENVPVLHLSLDRVDVVGVIPRNLQTGDKIRIILETPYDEDTFSAVAHAYKKRFTVTMDQQIALSEEEEDSGQEPLDIK